MRTKAQRDAAARLVCGIRQEQCPMEVIVRKWEPKRSSEQNRRHWALLNAIAAYLPEHLDGVWHHPDVLHAYFCARFLGVEGVEMGSDRLSVPRRSRNLTVAEFRDLDEQIEAYMATEFGFAWSEHQARQ